MLDEDEEEVVVDDDDDLDMTLGVVDEPEFLDEEDDADDET
jgi:hypothetical protein